MGLLANYPIKINNTALPSPSSWSESSRVVENVLVTEAGTDLIDVTRYDKLEIAVNYKIAESAAGGEWAKFFKSISVLDSVTVSRYDILAQDYEDRTMRVRNFRANLVPKSDRLSAVNGVWNISFTLLEF